MDFKLIESVLDNIPAISISGVDYVPVFSYGTKADLLKWLRLKNKERGKKYPLVWLETPFSSQKRNQVQYAEVNIICATLSNKNMSNRERTSITFATTLDPLVDSVISALNKSAMFRVNSEVIETTKYFNYDSDESTGATDIWDAISLQISIELNLNCI